ncbi:universal stress protein [Halorubrum sp. CBA1125]|uniref:universal stress protein n=1 Tax=Halorubrum sp. CBA1125 TaxID=2668072 RepID=UPI0012E8E79D|nr:universal stress protein [Halorubrum sp. CBA1125]MUW14216.1 universal stress protein [Halorubrum sp. CBA1125]
MYDTVLIPTDGSDHSVRAAEHGHYLAQMFDATVHVINVVDIQGTAGMFDAGGLVQSINDQLIAEGETAIEAVEAVVGERDPVTTAVVKGEPSETILKYAEDHDVDMITMGTHGRTGLNRYIAGSVTERVIRLADVPVLSVRTTDQSQPVGEYDEVLIPTDGSEPAAMAIDHGLAIAQKTGARIHAVNIVDVGDVAAGPSYTPPTEVIEDLESEGEVATDRIATQARARGLDAITEVREGFPASELLDYADESDIDLITMGTTGRTGLNRYLLGSTTERIIRLAEIPVLAVNARE